MYKVTLGTGDVLEAQWVQEGIHRVEDVDGTKDVEWILTINMGPEHDDLERIYATVNQPGALNGITVHDEYGHQIFGPSDYEKIDYAQIMPDARNIKNVIIAIVREANIPTL